MIRHCIILSSSYSTGRRICLHYTGDDYSKIDDAITKIRGTYDGKIVPYSTYIVHTDLPDWESVIDKDPYFDDVEVIDTLDEFVERISRDRYLKGLEVARYIMSKYQCTHTRLEKLTYMCYADYLCSTGERLFEDKIYAFSYGPVIDSVYKAFSSESREHPCCTLDSAKILKDHPTPYVGDFAYSNSDSTEILKGESLSPIKSRILFSEDGLMKIESIDRTLKKYEDVATSDLISLTHKDGTPWSVTDRNVRYAEITDEAILNYHSKESSDVVKDVD